LGIGHCGLPLPPKRLRYVLVVHLHGEPTAVLRILHCDEGAFVFYHVLVPQASDYLFQTDVVTRIWSG
jgi:hypothetical protein